MLLLVSNSHSIIYVYCVIGLFLSLIVCCFQVTKKFGVPGLKVAMEWFGYYGGPVRSPLQPITTEQEEIMRAAFKLSGFVH